MIPGNPEGSYSPEDIFEGNYKAGCPSARIMKGRYAACRICLPHTLCIPWNNYIKQNWRLRLCADILLRDDNPLISGGCVIKFG